MGKELSKLLPRQTNWQLTNYAWIHQYTWLGFRFRRRYANRSSARTPTKCRLRKDHQSNRCILNICFCIPSIQSNSRQHSQSYHQHYDKSCVFTNCNDDGQRLSFRLHCNSRKSECPRYDTQPCNRETNHRSLRKNACHDKNITENVFRRISQTIAQILTISTFKLQHNVSHEYRLWTQPNISRTSILQRTRSQARTNI